MMSGLSLLWKYWYYILLLSADDASREKMISMLFKQFYGLTFLSFDNWGTKSSDILGMWEMVYYFWCSSENESKSFCIIQLDSLFPLMILQEFWYSASLMIHLLDQIHCHHILQYNDLTFHARFSFTISTYHKMGANYLLTLVNLVITIYIGKNSVCQLGYLKVKINFSWSSLDSPVTCGGNFKNYQNNYCPKNNHLMCSTQ